MRGRACGGQKRPASYGAGEGVLGAEGSSQWSWGGAERAVADALRVPSRWGSGYRDHEYKVVAG